MPAGSHGTEQITQANREASGPQRISFPATPFTRNIFNHEVVGCVLSVHQPAAVPLPGSQPGKVHRCLSRVSWTHSD